MGRPEPGHQDSQVIIDFSDRPNRRAGSVAQVFLFNGNSRREALDMLQPWLLHLVDKLPGIRAQALHVATLSLGVNRVHCQGTLATATGTTKDGHLIAGYFRIHHFQVVLLGTTNADHLRTRG